MKPTVHMCLQYSDEWWNLRRGIPTASSFDRILTAKTMKPSSQQADYIAELIADLANPDPAFTAHQPQTRDMANGTNMEPEARRWYSMATDQDVQQVGFVVSACGRFGCSPDGLIGETGGLELKCPTLKTQVRYLQSGELPAEYRAQVHGCLIVTGREWWDFASYAPGLKPLLVRVVPDEFTEALRRELERFHERYQRIREEIGLPIKGAA